MKRTSLHFPVTAGAVLNKLLNQYGLQRSYSRHQVINLWPKIVSPSIARHAQVERITERILHIAVDSSVWMNEMAALKDVLLSKVNACLCPGATTFQDIRFSQRSWLSRSEKVVSKAEEYALDEKERRRVRSLLEPLRNEDLKSVMARIIEKDVQLKKKRTAIHREKDE